MKNRTVNYVLKILLILLLVGGVVFAALYTNNVISKKNSVIDTGKSIIEKYIKDKRDGGELTNVENILTDTPTDLSQGSGVSTDYVWASVNSPTTGYCVIANTTTKEIYDTYNYKSVKQGIEENLKNSNIRYDDIQVRILNKTLREDLINSNIDLYGYLLNTDDTVEKVETDDYMTTVTLFNKEDLQTDLLTDFLKDKPNFMSFVLSSVKPYRENANTLDYQQATAKEKEYYFQSCSDYYLNTNEEPIVDSFNFSRLEKDGVEYIWNSDCYNIELKDIGLSDIKLSEKGNVSNCVGVSISTKNSENIVSLLWGNTDNSLNELQNVLLVCTDSTMNNKFLVTASGNNEVKDEIVQISKHGLNGYDTRADKDNFYCACSSLKNLSDTRICIFTKE